jgi:hypothetical protein
MKSKTAEVLTACLALAAAHIACSDGPRPAAFDRKTETAAVAKTIDAAIGWAKTKDFNLLYSVIAPDSNYLEVDPGEGLILGIDQFRKNEAFWANPDFRAIRHEIRDLRIDFSRSGDAAWFYCRLDDVNEWKGKPASWMNARWTGVLEKRDSRWRIVQMHFSFADE